MPHSRMRYPLRAYLAVAASALFVLAEIALLATCLMPLVPLVPVFVAIMIANACLLSPVLEYAASLGRPEQVLNRGGEATNPATPAARRGNPQAT